jgi:hypothetical protein
MEVQHLEYFFEDEPSTIVAFRFITHGGKVSPIVSRR